MSSMTYFETGAIQHQLLVCGTDLKNRKPLRVELQSRVSEVYRKMTGLLRLRFGDTVGTPIQKDNESSANDHVKAETP
jgi:hypothetical protein